jgi:hypothetical protein
MYLQDGTRSHFMKFLEREFPSMLPRYERLYAAKYPPKAYRTEVQGMVRALQQRYRLTSREDRHTGQIEPEEGHAPEQVGFGW